MTSLRSETGRRVGHKPEGGCLRPCSLCSIQIGCATISAGISGDTAAEHPSLWHPPSQCHVTPVQHALPPPTVPGVHSLKIRTCFRPHRTLRQALVNLKGWIPLQQKAGVIYRIPCNGCPRVYVGQTGRTLAQRLREHKQALVSGHLAQSAVAEHAAQESHDIDW